jgi:hypothetical protein
MQSPADLLGDHHAPQVVDAPDDASRFHPLFLLLIFLSGFPDVRKSLRRQ